MKNVLPDLFLLGGLGAMIYGVALLWVPGAWILGGFAAITLGIAAAAQKAG